MRKIRVELLVSLFVLFSLNGVVAKVRLPALVSNGMVLQRDRDIKIWGYADRGEAVRVRFMDKEYSIMANREGEWSVLLPPMPKGGPYKMEINDLILRDIIVGDVWLCSGQSNMELPVSRVMDMFRDEVEGYHNPLIRQLKVPMAYDFDHPQQDMGSTQWQSLTPESALSFSAVAYFFAKDLYEKTEVPIGLINASVGGSPAEAWISEEGLRDFPAYLNEKDICQSDEYVAAVKSLDRMNRDLWSQVLYRNDPGLSEFPKWFDVDYDDSGWSVINLFDKSWGSDGLNPLNGSHWLRKSFNVPAHLLNKPATLRFGCVVDADSVFINGTFVGTTSYQYPPRIYSIPSHLLREGANNITVRLISYSGHPQVVEDKPYKIVFEQEEISLEGDWRYKSGTRMRALPGETFFHYKPVGLFNGMIAPLIDWPIAGVLWYQGESNTDRYNEYYDLMSALMNDWRNHWNRPDLPFFIVQLANFMQDPRHPSESNWAELRNVQRLLSLTIPSTALVVTIDVGEWNDIHPLNKKEVGRRLSLQAQRKVYGDVSVVSDGPVFEQMIIDDGRLILSFREGTDELLPVDQLEGFAIAGADGKYRWAKAVIKENKVIVWHENVPRPVMLRYAWGHNPANANLRNKVGLPASPFEASLSSASY